MSRQYYFSDWEYQKNYLIRNLFRESRPSTIPEESHEEVSPVETNATQVSPFESSTAEETPHLEAPLVRPITDTESDSSSLPSLTVEVVPKVNKHDDPPEYYVNLERRILRYYRRLVINNESDATLSTKSDMSLTDPIGTIHLDSDGTDEYIDVQTIYSAKGEALDEDAPEIINKDVGNKTYVIRNEDDASTSKSISSEEKSCFKVTFTADIHAEPKKLLNQQNDENVSINHAIERTNSENTINLDDERRDEDENLDVSEEKSVILESSYPSKKSTVHFHTPVENIQEKVIIINEEIETEEDNENLNEELGNVSPLKDNSEESSKILETSCHSKKSLSLQESSFVNAEVATGTNNDTTQNFVEVHENVSRDHSEERSVILENSYLKTKSLSLQENNITDPEVEIETNIDKSLELDEGQRSFVVQDNDLEKQGTVSERSNDSPEFLEEIEVMRCQWKYTSVISQIGAAEDQSLSPKSFKTGDAEFASSNSTIDYTPRRYTDLDFDALLATPDHPENLELGTSIENVEPYYATPLRQGNQEPDKNLDIEIDTTIYHPENIDTETPRMIAQRKIPQCSENLDKTPTQGVICYAAHKSPEDLGPKRRLSLDNKAKPSENLQPKTSKISEDTVTVISPQFQDDLELDAPILQVENDAVTQEKVDPETRLNMEINATQHAENLESNTLLIRKSSTTLQPPQNISALIRIGEKNSEPHSLENPEIIARRMPVTEYDVTQHMDTSIQDASDATSENLEPERLLQVKEGFTQHLENIEPDTPMLGKECDAPTQFLENLEPDTIVQDIQSGVRQRPKINPEIPTRNDTSPKNSEHLESDTVMLSVDNAISQSTENLESDIFMLGDEEDANQHHSEHDISMLSTEKESTLQRSNNRNSKTPTLSNATAQNLEYPTSMQSDEDNTTQQRSFESGVSIIDVKDRTGCSDNQASETPIRDMKSAHPIETLGIEIPEFSDFVTARKRLKRSSSLNICSTPSKKGKLVDVGVQTEFPVNSLDVNVQTDFDSDIHSADDDVNAIRNLADDVSTQRYVAAYDPPEFGNVRAHRNSGPINDRRDNNNVQKITYMNVESVHSHSAQTETAIFLTECDDMRSVKGNVVDVSIQTDDVNAIRNFANENIQTDFDDVNALRNLTEANTQKDFVSAETNLAQATEFDDIRSAQENLLNVNIQREFGSGGTRVNLADIDVQTDSNEINTLRTAGCVEINFDDVGVQTNFEEFVTQRIVSNVNSHTEADVDSNDERNTSNSRIQTDFENSQRTFADIGVQTNDGTRYRIRNKVNIYIF